MEDLFWPLVPQAWHHHEGDVISSRELTNSLKLVRVGLNEVFAGVSGEVRDMPEPEHVLAVAFLDGLVGSHLLEFDCTAQLDNSQF